MVGDMSTTNTTTNTGDPVGTCDACGATLYDDDGMLVDAWAGYDCDGDGRRARYQYPFHDIEGWQS